MDDQIHLFLFPCHVCSISPQGVVFCSTGVSMRPWLCLGHVHHCGDICSVYPGHNTMEVWGSECNSVQWSVPYPRLNRCVVGIVDSALSQESINYKRMQLEMGCEIFYAHLLPVPESVLLFVLRTKFRIAMNKADSAAGSKAIDSLINYETVKVLCTLLPFFPLDCLKKA